MVSTWTLLTLRTMFWVVLYMICNTALATLQIRLFKVGWACHDGGGVFVFRLHDIIIVLLQKEVVYIYPTA